MFEDGILTKVQLVKFTGLSATQIDRLEKVHGSFPHRVQLSGNGYNSKVGWCKRSVVEWLARRPPPKGKPPTLEK